jgi:lipid-A-disaccharide synthase
VATLLVSAGDASGDLHGAEFARRFRERHPDCCIAGLGGDAMRDAGVELLAHQRDLAVGGLVELAGSLPAVARVWRRMGAALAARRPDLVVLIDSGGFNLPFARRVRRSSRAKILYYVAPQVWAWRSGRIRKLAERVDRLAVIFPFEQEVYRDTQLAVDFVGHPLVDSLAPLASLDPEAARRACGIDPAGPVVTLMPGSRRNEISAHLGVQLETAHLLDAERPGVRFLLAVAPSLGDGVEIRSACDRARDSGLSITLLRGRSREAIVAADVVLAKPGTVTMECALLARPMVVMGRAKALTAWFVRRAIRVPSLAMPNLIAEEAIVPEFLQDDAVPSRLADALGSLLSGPARELQLARLADVRKALGSGGAADRACRIAEEMLAAARA